MLDTDLDPRSSSKHMLTDWRAYAPADTWTVPLLASLLELRHDNWEVLFDVEDEMITLEDGEISFMVEVLCRGQGGMGDDSWQDVINGLHLLT